MTEAMWLYPQYVIRKVKEYVKENYNYEADEDWIACQKPESILKMYLEWEGIIGYETDILDILNADPIAWVEEEQ